MILTVQPPSPLDAEEMITATDTSKSYRLKFYTKRRNSGGLVLTTLSADGKTYDQVLVKVSQDGKIGFDRLNEEISPEVEVEAVTR